MLFAGVLNLYDVNKAVPGELLIVNGLVVLERINSNMVQQTRKLLDGDIEVLQINKIIRK